MNAGESYGNTLLACRNCQFQIKQTESLFNQAQKQEKQIEEEQKQIQMGGDNEVTEGKVQMTSDLIETMSLVDEPGIKSLENLYKDFMKIEIDSIFSR